MVASHHWPLDQAHEPSVRTCGSSRTEQDYYRNDESSIKRLLPFALREVSVLAELAGTSALPLTDVPPQPNNHLNLSSERISATRRQRAWARSVILTVAFRLTMTRGCSPWRPAADMGTDRHENYTISLGFSRANRGAPDTARDAVLLREQRPYLRTSRFQGHELLQRKDNSSPGPPSTSPSSVALPHLVPKDLSPCPGWGILTPFPFGRQRDKHEHVFAFRQTSRFGTDFSDPLGPTDPCSTAVHMEPFSSFSPQGSHLSICYYHQDLHRWRLQAGSRPAPSTHATATLLLTAA
ncbi:hypothetical protein JTE90_008895 [Oedothorax gibbosus]|uniref:Uncharacterized protein n=1 Tax=Oedothorax gibbosus TaxID=931172 RepID=A0AAV6TG63_9ARAC|nr:hypothetical protein JTE90_008895 [Oedothorax gibbosus]